jgi:hypothetical protein
VSHLHDGRVLLGATHHNGCPRNGAVTRKSLFAKELLRPDAKREFQRSEITTGNTVVLRPGCKTGDLALSFSFVFPCSDKWTNAHNTDVCIALEMGRDADLQLDWHSAHHNEWHALIAPAHLLTKPHRGGRAHNILLQLFKLGMRYMSWRSYCVDEPSYSAPGFARFPSSGVLNSTDEAKVNGTLH